MERKVLNIQIVDRGSHVDYRVTETPTWASSGLPHTLAVGTRPLSGRDPADLASCYAATVEDVAYCLARLVDIDLAVTRPLF